MTSTEIVVLISSATTLAVAASGYLFNYYAGKRDKEANRELAERAQAHERQLRDEARDRMLAHGFGAVADTDDEVREPPR